MTIRIFFLREKTLELDYSIDALSLSGKKFRKSDENRRFSKISTKPEVVKKIEGPCAPRGKIPEQMPFKFFKYLFWFLSYEGTTSGQTDRQTEIHTDRQTERQTDGAKILYKSL